MWRKEEARGISTFVNIGELVKNQLKKKNKVNKRKMDGTINHYWCYNKYTFLYSFFDNSFLYSYFYLKKLFNYCKSKRKKVKKRKSLSTVLLPFPTKRSRIKELWQNMLNFFLYLNVFNFMVIISELLSYPNMDLGHC
jgi:hypothetical protein